MNQEQFIQKTSRLKASVREAPLEPGVYIMRDEENRVIYVGKARILRKRLNSYFSGEKDVKTRTLLKYAHSIETIIVSNEYEALLLENTLIKQHSPKYNINLKDGKSYPVIRITSEDFPRIFRTRHIVQDGSEYFGPFPNVQAVDTLLHLIDTLYPLRKCKILKKRQSPCMYYHIGRCSAPCCGKISREDYAEQVNRVKKLLSGDTEALVQDLATKMTEAAQEQQYERAAKLRDIIRAIQDLSAENSVVDFDQDDRDYVSWAEEGVLCTFTVFSMRGGRMTGRELFRTRSASSEEESVQLFLASYYGPDRIAPPRIYLATKTIDFSELRRLFKERFDHTVSFVSPDERRHEAVLAMAYQNAREDLVRRLRERGAGPALEELARRLSLARRPERIEGFDIAQLDGKHTVASLVSFKDGIPDKKNYRHYKLRTVEGIIDDFGAMREAVSRRYSRLLAEGKELPDLIMIDGGIGQVNAANGVLNSLGLDIDIVGLAKRDEELWKPGASEPIRLERRSEALKVLQFVRDETHRFATGLNQKLRSKDLILPALQSVEGIGPKKAALLLREFGSLESLSAARVEDIQARGTLKESAAIAVRAAAKLALQDREIEGRRLRTSGGRKMKGSGTKTQEAGSSEAARLAALAAENPEPYARGNTEDKKTSE